MGLITRIPKGVKLGNEYKNCHPMTLLNSVYKFYSAIWAERIKKNLPKLIYIDQKGLMNGIFIGGSTRLIYNIINKHFSQNLKGLILSIDFKKAFDSLSWEFILKTIELFNFG